MTNREVYERDCEELEQYRKIGTVEECREAVEKQKPKKPEISDILTITNALFVAGVFGLLTVYKIITTA